MPRKSLDTEIRNFARGGLAYRTARWRISKFMTDHGAERLTPLPAFLSDSLLKLKVNVKSHALPFSEEEWKWVARLESGTTPQVEDNYITLLGQCLTANIDSINRLLEFQNLVSKSMLLTDVSGIETGLNALDHHSKQSLFVFKTAAALYSHSQKSITDYFVNNPHSDWVRHVFLYPLIYSTLSRPDDDFLPKLVAQVFPSSETNTTERAGLVYLLRDESVWHMPLSVRVYFGLALHPFDAYTFIINYTKQQIALRIPVKPSIVELLKSLCGKLSDPSLPHLVGVLEGETQEYNNSVDNVVFATALGMTAEESDFFKDFFDATSLPPTMPSAEVLQAMHRMRWAKYPTKPDFDMAVGFADLYPFTTAGRMLHVMLTSIFMLTRRNVEFENRDLIEQLLLTGGVSAFLLSSPRGAYALSSGLINPPKGESWVQIETNAASYLEKSPDSSRVWIKAFHFRLRGAERLMRMQAWLSAVRSAIPISANSRFLSGIDWRWMGEVIDAQHIRPFSGSIPGIYALLIRVIEESMRDSNEIRMALRPIVDNTPTVLDLVEWAIQSYGSEALAFVRFVLTPEMILKLKLEQYYPAALTERLRSLERVVSEFGFSDEILTKEQFEDEQRNLTNSLTLMNVGAAQFEMAWVSLRLDAISGARDAYQALMAVDETHHAVHALAQFEKEAPLSYSNGASRTYVLRNSEWPKAILIAQIVDTFLSHPSYGIESILAVRIRHDNFRYELSLAVDNLKTTQIANVNDYDKQQLILLFEEAIYQEVQRWIDVSMHTTGLGGSEPTFNFLPSQDEMKELISSSTADLAGIVTAVFGWLKDKLEISLGRVRDGLNDDLWPALERTIHGRAEEIAKDNVEGSECVGEVARALLSGLKRRCDELQDWFRSPAEGEPTPLSLAELKMAVDGRYRAEIEAGKLVIKTALRELEQAPLKAEHVRLMFDIWCEVARNAMKYSGHTPATVRVTRMIGDRSAGLVFSSALVDGTPEQTNEVGHPYGSVNDALFQSGRSGIVKIAHLAASIAGAEVTVEVHKRRRAFHLIVPLYVQVGEVR